MINDWVVVVTEKNKKTEDKKLMIRNSTAEFLIFENQAKATGIEVRFEDETLWL